MSSGALSDPIIGPGDRAGLLLDILHLFGDKGYQNDFDNHFKASDNEVLESSKSGKGLLFFIGVEHNLATDYREIWSFKPVASGATFRETLVRYIASIPDVGIWEPSGPDKVTVIGYGFAKAGPDGSIVRELGSEAFVNEAKVAAVEALRVTSLRAQAVKEQNAVKASVSSSLAESKRRQDAAKSITDQRTMVLSSQPSRVPPDIRGVVENATQGLFIPSFRSEPLRYSPLLKGQETPSVRLPSSSGPAPTLAPRL